MRETVVRFALQPHAVRLIPPRQVYHAIESLALIDGAAIDQVMTSILAWTLAAEFAPRFCFHSDDPLRAQMHVQFMAFALQKMYPERTWALSVDALDGALNCAGAIIVVHDADGDRAKCDDLVARNAEAAWIFASADAPCATPVAVPARARAATPLWARTLCLLHSVPFAWSTEIVGLVERGVTDASAILRACEKIQNTS